MQTSSTSPRLARARPSRPARILCGAILLLALGACGKPGKTQLVWYEEAQQDDGTIILVKKTEAGYSITRKEPGARNYGYRPTTVSMTDPKTGQLVVWNPRGLPPLWPYALHVHDDTLYFFATPYLAGEFAEYGCPLPPYIVFRWEGDHWKRIPIGTLPRPFKRHNLLSSAGLELYEGKLNEGRSFYISSEQVIRADVITTHVRKLSGRLDRPNPDPHYLYQREIQHTDRGRIYECSGYNGPSRYDHVELR